MAISVIVQYNSGFLPDILLLIQAPIVVCLLFCSVSMGLSSTLY